MLIEKDEVDTKLIKRFIILKTIVAFVSDAAIRKALERTGASRDEARTCNITYCYEYSARGSYGA